MTTFERPYRNPPTRSASTYSTDWKPRFSEVHDGRGKKGKKTPAFVTIVGITRDVMEVASDIPYVGAIATLVKRLIDIREELETQKDRCAELLDRTFGKTERIFTYLLELKQYDTNGDFKGLKVQMQRYHEFLREVVETVTKLQKRRFLGRILNRGTDELDRLDRMINNFDSDLITGMIMEIIKTLSRKGPTDTGRQSSSDNTMPFPSGPVRILERDIQHHLIVNALLSSPNVRVAILGMGGIGKTTLACSVARNSQVMREYPRRMFLSFEGFSTPDLAYANLAHIFNLPTDRRSSNTEVLAQILDYLSRKKTLIIIDNFETFWEVPQNRRSADEFLNQLGTLPNLAMIVTLRGTQRPGSIPWLKLDPLETLTPSASESLLQAIAQVDYSDKERRSVQNLLEAVAGIPLAVTLIGSLLRDGTETPDSLWSRWTRERTRAIGADVEDRQYHLDISLRLSVFGPRMSDHARDVLCAVSILPLGMTMDDAWLDDFQKALLQSISIRDCIRSLKNVALGSLDQSTSPPRLQLLPPVKDFCAKNLSMDTEVSQRLADIYSEKLNSHKQYENTVDYTWFTSDISNVTAVLNHSLSSGYVSEEIGDGAVTYTRWMHYLGTPTIDIVKLAIKTLTKYPSIKADALQALGENLLYLGQYQEAIPPLEQAIAIRKDVGDPTEIAWDLSFLGQAYIHLKDDEAAERNLKDSIEQFSKADDKEGKAHSLALISDLYRERSNLPRAEEAAKEALELQRSMGKKMGEVNALNVLGEVYREQEKYIQALDISKTAASIADTIHYAVGHGHAEDNMGRVYHRTRRYDLAAKHYKEAIALFEQAACPDYAASIRKDLVNIQSLA